METRKTAHMVLHAMNQKIIQDWSDSWWPIKWFLFFLYQFIVFDTPIFTPIQVLEKFLCLIKMNIFFN